MNLLTTNQDFDDRTRLKCTLISIGIALLCIWPMIFSGNMSGRGAWDDLQYHWIAIHVFSEQIPNPDLSDYASATTPGYHLLLAPIVALGAGHLLVQLIASFWTLSLVSVLTWILSKRIGFASILVVIPMTISMYVLFPGIWLLPDNAGWLGVLLIILCALGLDSEQRIHWFLLGIASLLLIGLVWIRQIHIWSAGVIWISAWIGKERLDPGLIAFLKPNTARLGRVIIGIGLTVPAFGMLLWFIGMWGGLVPPTFQGQHQGPNIATPGFILTQIAIISLFFAPILWGSFKSLWKYHFGTLVLVIFLGVMIGCVPESSYSIEHGRFGGWWGLTNKLPLIADRSVLIMLGSGMGACAAASWIAILNRRDGWILLGAMCAFVAAQSANHASWQRYHEPMILMLIILVLSRSAQSVRFVRSIALGSALLALLLGGLTLMSLLKAEPIEQMRLGETQAQVGLGR